MSKELTTASSISRDQIDLWKRTYCKGVSNDELELFVNVCRRTGLSPEARQIFAVKRGNTMTIQTSIDGLRLIAERSGKYAGQLGPFYTDDGVKWLDCWVKDTPPLAAKVAALRHDFKEPVWASARFKAYSQSSQPWQKMPDLMIAKCAEALALRKAFPQECSGLYTEDEMEHVNVIKVKPLEDPKPPLISEDEKRTKLYATWKEQNVDEYLWPMIFEKLKAGTQCKTIEEIVTEIQMEQGEKTLDEQEIAF